MKASVEVKEVLKKVDIKWSKDKIIRFLYVKLAPYFQRDLDYFLADDIDQFSMYYKNEFKKDTNLVVCKTICNQYQQIYQTFGIKCKIITTNNKLVPHYALIVEGNLGWYFIDPLKDLFANQLGLKTAYFGTTPIIKHSSVIKQYPFLIELSQEYIERLDLELNLIARPEGYMNLFFDTLHQEITTNKAIEYFGVEKKDLIGLIIKKIKFMEKYLINLGNINGLYERNVFYEYLISCIFNKREKNNISSNIITKDSCYAISISLKSNLLENGEISFQEYKDKKGVYRLTNK